MTFLPAQRPPSVGKPSPEKRTEFRIQQSAMDPASSTATESIVVDGGELLATLKSWKGDLDTLKWIMTVVEQAYSDGTYQFVRDVCRMAFFDREFKEFAIPALQWGEFQAYMALVNLEGEAGVWIDAATVSFNRAKSLCEQAGVVSAEVEECLVMIAGMRDNLSDEDEADEEGVEESKVMGTEVADNPPAVSGPELELTRTLPLHGSSPILHDRGNTPDISSVHSPSLRVTATTVQDGDEDATAGAPTKVGEEHA